MNKLIKHKPCSMLQDLPRDRGLWHVSQAVFWLELICFMVCMTWHYTYHTTVSFLNGAQQRRLLEIVTLIAVFNIVFLCGYSRRQLFEIAALLLLLAVSRYNSHYDDGYLLYSMAIALSCRRVQLNELIRRLFYIYHTIFFGVLFLYRLGIFSPMDSGEERYRMNLGFSHYNTMGMVIVCIILLWMLLRYEKMCWLDYLSWIAAAVFVWEVPNSRTAALCILLLTAGVFFSRCFGILCFRPIKLIVLSMFPLMAVFSYISSYYYTSDNTTLLALDSLFSGRLYYGNSYLNKYKPTLFGQKIRRINPDIAARSGIPSEILDNGYLRILLQLGIITFIVMMLIFIYILYKALKEKHYAVAVGLVVISFYNVSEFYMTSLFADTFLFFFTYYRYGRTESTKAVNSIPGERAQNMREHRFYGKYIDMKQCLHYLALHWLSILLAAAVFAAAACGLSLKDQAEAKRANLEKYPDGQKEVTLSLSAEEQASLQQYISDTKLLNVYTAYSEEALYMAIDPNNVPHYVLSYTFSCPEETDSTIATNRIRAFINAMQQEARKDEFFDSLATISGLEETSSSNLRDLITITAANNTQVSVEICAPDEETLTTLASAFISLWEKTTYSKVQGSDTQTQMVQDENYIYTSRDTKIRDAQAGVLNQVSSYATKSSNDLGKLSDNARKYLEKYEESEDISLGDPITYKQKVSAAGISKKKAGMAGMKAGVLAAALLAVFWLIVYLASNRIWGRRTLERSYNISNLGSFIADETAEHALKRTNTVVWKFYIRHASRDGQASQEVAFTLRSLLGLTGGKKHRHILILSDSLSCCERMKEQLQNFLCDEIAEKVTILTGQELISQDKQNTVTAPENVDAVLTAAVMGCSTYANMENLISLGSLYGEKMLGYLMVE